jgi:hypothetical protein
MNQPSSSPVRSLRSAAVWRISLPISSLVSFALTEFSSSATMLFSMDLGSGLAI